MWINVYEYKKKKKKKKRKQKKENVHESGHNDPYITSTDCRLKLMF